MARRTGEEMLRELMRRNAALGGHARAASMSPEQRRASARKAGKASGAARRAKANNR
jgi:hypothetical protein